MNDVWQQIVGLIKQVANHPNTREFAEELRKFVLGKMIAWLEGVLAGRPDSGLSAVA